MAKRTVEYPEWVEKYRTKGRTIRKVRNGYALYHCTSERVEGKKYPKMTQEYLGMVTEKDGFIPKRELSTTPRYLEYGLSHMLWENFGGQLRHLTYNSGPELAQLVIVRFIFGSCDDICIRSCWLTAPNADRFIEVRNRQAKLDRIERISEKLKLMLEEKIPDQQERSMAVRLLMLCVVEEGPRASIKPEVPAEVKEILNGHGLKYPE